MKIMRPFISAPWGNSAVSASATGKLLGSLIIIACLSVSGCKALQSAPSRWINGAQVGVEYRDEAESLELAPGWTWPEQLSFPDSAQDGSVQMYEVNTGRVEAAWYWHCSWSRTFLAAAQPEEREEALANVLRIRESAFYKWGSDELERQRKDQLLEDVKQGNLKFFEQTVELNCPVISR
ncbi:hypothetical protein [Micromonospora zamorensis]|uniref:hypothetical protein n=1 Tax=Micromonospora zamorensis TaxID=709883 RepID=UPI0033AFC2BD